MRRKIVATESDTQIGDPYTPKSGWEWTEDAEEENTTGTEGCNGGWTVDATASNKDLAGKWSDMCETWSWLDMKEGIWPNILICEGNRVVSAVEGCAQTPEWVVVDGGALHSATTKRMARDRLQLWGVHKSVSVWTTRLDYGYTPCKHQPLKAMAAKLEIELQRRAGRAFYAVGRKRFKMGTQETDFHIDNIQGAIATNPNEIWGEECGIEEWELQPFALWPAEPETEARTANEWQISGIENEIKESAEEKEERRLDRAEWVKNGQKWIDAFTTTARRRVLRFLHENARGTTVLLKGKSNVQNKFGKVEDLYLEETDYRPGARRAIWSWYSGKCEEVRPQHMASEAKYNIKNIRTAATQVGFKDIEALEWLTKWGTTHNTHNFPLCSYASRNHQGAALQIEAITMMIKEKVNEGHFVESNQGLWSTTPITLPFGIVPVNGTVQKPKEAEMLKKLHGNPYKENVRGTWDGSSPHDGRSPNDACDLIPELNAKWVTIEDITQSMCVLMATRTTVEIFKLDLRRAYTQMVMMNTQRWRQTVFWKWLNDENEVVGGFMQDSRSMWGMTHSGNGFYRTITSLTVRYVTHQLMKEWAPFIKCPFAKRWIQKRKLAGFGSQKTEAKTDSSTTTEEDQTMPDNGQAMPADIQAFLDDFWIMVASSIKEERDKAREIVLTAFEYLGWTLSTSKFKEEGTLATEAVLIGHHVCTVTQTRGVTFVKQERLRHSITPMLSANRWDRKELSQVLGLAESVRGDVCRRWRLGPAYRVLHAGTDEK